MASPGATAGREVRKVEEGRRGIVKRLEGEGVWGGGGLGMI